MTLQPKDLTTKAMLVSLNIKQWNTNKKDKQATTSLQEQFTNDAGWARGNKSIASKQALSKMTGIVSEARQFHLINTLPWSDEGFRILPSKNFDYYSTKMREYVNQFNNAVVGLVSELPQIKEEAKRALKGLYNELDYPDSETLKAKHSINVNISPIPAQNDFRVTQITESDFADITAQIEQRLIDANKIMTSDLYSRLYDVVEKAFQAFDDPTAKFHDSKLDNISEVVETIKRLNIDDPKLDRFCKLADEKIASLDPAELRSDFDARKQAANDAKNLLSRLDGYL